MRSLIIFLLLIGVASANPHTCRTRNDRIEARFDNLCIRLHAEQPPLATWNDNKCARLFMELGMLTFWKEQDRAAGLKLMRQKIARQETDWKNDQPTPSPTATPTP